MKKATPISLLLITNFARTLAVFVTLSLLTSLQGAPGDPDDTLTFFGPRPIFTNGGKTNVIVDDFAWLDGYIAEQQQTEIAATIDEWRQAGIGYAAYYALVGVESQDAIDFMGDAGKAYDLDGNPLNSFMFTRSSFRDYLINAGKTAIDLGTNYFMLDNASLNLGTLSFDSETISAFQDYLSANYTVEELASMGVSDVSTFDYADYLKSAEGGSYTDTDSLDDNIPGDDLWYAWIEAVKGVERAFYEEWTSELRNHALSTYSREIYLGANRSVGPNQWANIDKLDYAMSETFIDTLGYPYYNLDHVYKNARNFDKRFWSWGFPANTGEFNGSGDPYGRLHITELSKLFLSETLAAGGLHQIPIDWVSYYHDDARLATLQPYYEFARSHPELFNLSEAGEVAVLYNEAFEKADTGNYTPGYLGIMMLLADSHRPFDVVFAGDPEARDGADPFSTTDLSTYKAIILPNAQMLTDSQVSQLESYLSGGGTLIGLGQIANQDENGNDVSSSRILDDYFTLDGTSTVGSGLAICFTTNLGDNYHGNSATNIGPSEYDWEVTAQNLSDTADYRSTWSSVVDSQLSQDFVGTSLPSTVHLHRYEDSDGSHIYQIVNRDINMTESVDDQTINTTSDSACSVAIPEGFTGGTVTLSWMTVEEPTATELSFIVNGDQLEFDLPGFNIWGVLKVGSVAENPTSIDETPEANFNLLDASSGYRPDKLESSGIFESNYNYWKGGNHGSVPWDIPYWATDDNEVDQVRLYYRYSTDRESWGSWVLHNTESVSGSNISDTISFNAPDGEGHYQFRIQAVDDNGQEEYVDTSRDETAYGFDETDPDAPTNVQEASHESGTWIEDPSSLTFTWDSPSDNLSGHSGAYVTITTESTVITDDSLGTDVHTWSPGLTGLVDGQRYKFTYRNEDEAGNWATTYEAFTFRYGTLPVADPISPSVTEGDGQLTVDWTNPSDVNFDYVILYYREADNLYASWTSDVQSPDSSATSLDITGLTNDTGYQISIRSVTTSVSTSPREGNEIIIEGTYTPQAGLGGGGSEPTELEGPTGLTLEDNPDPGNIRLEWTDNASDETGYVIEKRLQGDTSWTTVATAGMNDQTFVDNTNIGSDTWEYRVKAIRDSESSDYTSIVSITRTSSGGSSSTPNAPANLNASDIGTEVELSWDDLSSNETNFVIERRLLGDSSWSTSLTRPANTTQFSDLTAAEGNTYEYRIKAINGGAHSAYSNIASVTYTGSGFIPSDPDSILITNFTVDGVTTSISIDTLSGRVYKLYISEDLENWSIFGTRVGTGGTQSFIFDSSSPSALSHFGVSEILKCFFRIELLP